MSCWYTTCVLQSVTEVVCTDILIGRKRQSCLPAIILNNHADVSIRFFLTNRFRPAIEFQ